MAGLGPGSSPQSMTVLQRAARLYEGDSWWLSDPHGDVRGLLLLDGGSDLGRFRTALFAVAGDGHGFTAEETGGMVGRSRQLLRQVSSHKECQVTVEERTQLFGFLKKG